MMFRRYALAIPFALSLYATSAAAQKPIGVPFDLGVGESVLITDAGIRVGFDHVASESRCAIGVLCVWEGNATARVWGEVSPENRADFDLNTNSQFQTDATYLAFVIRLLGVAPYPEDGIIIDPDEYQVTMVVQRLSPLPANTRTWGAIKALYR